MIDAPAWLHAALVAGIVLAAMRLVWVDVRKLEIELETLLVMALLGLAHSVIFVPGFETGIRIFAGASFYGLLVLCIRHVPGLARIGAGDPPLIGVIAFLVAPAIVQWSVLAAVMIGLTCGWYSHRRGKPLFKSMFPAAPPLLLSAIPVFLMTWG